MKMKSRDNNVTKRQTTRNLPNITSVAAKSHTLLQTSIQETPHFSKLANTRTKKFWFCYQGLGLSLGNSKPNPKL